MNIVFEYIKYRLNAKHLHGIHSPFVYKFMKEGMNIRMNENESHEVFESVSNALNNKGEILVKDYGAQSKKLKENRTVKQIFNTSSSYGKNALLLYRLSKYFKPNRVLELGTSLGIGTMHLFLGHPEAKITSIEGCPETFNLAQKHLNAKPIEIINSTFYDYINNLNDDKFDLIFIDGHHDGEALKYYLKLLDKHIHDNTLIVLDDIRWSNSMFACWNNLTSDKQYHLSMDFFKMGILIKRPQQQKEHFILKLKK